MPPYPIVISAAAQKGRPAAAQMSGTFRIENFLKSRNYVVIAMGDAPVAGRSPENVNGFLKSFLQSRFSNAAGGISR
jgi:hypothetical protein